jgi:hypothetical protein
MKIIPATYHQIPGKRDYIVFAGTAEQAAAAYQNRYGRNPETVYQVKMHPTGETVIYCEVT